MGMAAREKDAVARVNSQHEAPPSCIERLREEIWMPLTSLPLSIFLHGLWNFCLSYPSETCAVVYMGGRDTDFDGDEDVDPTASPDTTRVVRPEAVLTSQLVFLCLCCIQGPLMRWRVVQVERNHPPAKHHNVHEKIASGEIEKPCNCCKCCPACCY